MGFRPYALGGVEHAMEYRFQRVAARLRFLRQKICLLHLAQNLGSPTINESKPAATRNKWRRASSSRCT